MAKSVSSIKNTAVGSGKLIKRIAAAMVSLLIIVFSFIYLNNADKAARDTVSVVRVKSADLPAYTILSKDNIEKYDIIKKEYDDGKTGMIPYGEVDDINNMLTAYYLRGGSFLYRDQLVAEKPKRNKWLYDLPGDYEILTIPYNYMEAGGDILLPGDQIRIRVIYEAEDGGGDDYYYDTNPNYTFSSGRKTMRSDVLFDAITVTDMINSNARSIFEIYSEVMNLNDAQRQEIMKTSQFMSSIRPKALLLAGTKDQVDQYAKYKTVAGTSNFLITILHRTENEVILDKLPTLESEVSSWLKENQGK